MSLSQFCCGKQKELFGDNKCQVTVLSRYMNSMFSPLYIVLWYNPDDDALDVMLMACVQFLCNQPFSFSLSLTHFAFLSFRGERIELSYYSLLFGVSLCYFTYFTCDEIDVEKEQESSYFSPHSFSLPLTFFLISWSAICNYLFCPLELLFPLISKQTTLLESGEHDR